MVAIQNSISSEIQELIRQVIIGVFEILSPILLTLGTAMILLGLLAAIGLRQEWIGYRLIVGGGLMILFVLIAPRLLNIFLPA